MKRTILAVITVAALSGNVQAGGQDACAIWLCWPNGFMHPACLPAKKEMFRRMLKFKSPVPKFSSCTVDGKNPTNFRIVSGKAVYMKLPINQGSGQPLPGAEWTMLEGQWCNFRDTGHEEPRGCTKTITYTKMFEGDKQLGFTRYSNGLLGDPISGEITDDTN